MDAPRPVLLQVRKRRSAVVRGFLWSLLGVVGFTILLNVLLAGGDALSVRTLAPNLTLCAALGVALWLDHRDLTGQAVGLVSALIVGSVAISAFANGIADGGVSLVLLFVPVVLVGLSATRPGLHVAGAAALVTVLLPPSLRQAGLLPATGEVLWTVALQYALVLTIVIVFLDRFGSALREALLTSVDRGVALERETDVRRQVASRLREEKRFHEAIVDGFPGIFFVVRPDGRLIQWNRAFADLFGGERGVERSRVHGVVAGVEPRWVDAKLDQVLRDGAGAADLELAGPDGARLPYFLNATAVSLGEESAVAVAGVDTRELHAARGRIERLNHDLRVRLEHLTSLREIDKAITGSTDLDLTLKVVLEQVARPLGVDAACVLLHEPHGGTLRMGASRGFRHAGEGGELRLRLGEPQAGRVALTRERTIVDGAEAFERAFGGVQPLSSEGFEAYVGAPLVAQGKLYGVLELFHRSPLQPDADWLSFLDTLTTQVAIALSSATLFRNLERSNERLRSAYDTTIEGWARALDMRDEETEGHSRRVTDTTVRLASAIGMSDEDLVHVRRGALLHDIGKMGVPDAILLKPGKLDADEWAIMKRHPALAHELLAPIEFLRPALDIPYAHHERWDGGGYPRGLSGAAIPLAARIFAVADVYDALTSDRPYRAAWTRARALDHIRAESGTHFDPQVVTAFLAMMDEPPRDPAD